MKNKILFAIIIFALFVSAPRLVGAEQIDDFSVEIIISEDSVLEITETFIYDFGEESRHGIIRDIPFKYKNENGSRKLKIEFLGVTVEGKETAYKESTQGDNIQLKIGDPELALTGKQAYEIKYTAEGAINFFDDHDELYWNITGHDWLVPIYQSKAEIILPAPIMQRELKTDCFAGPLGSGDKCVSKRYIFSGQDMVEKIVFADDRLVPGSGATLVISLPKGILKEPSFLARGLGHLLILLLPLFVLAFLIYTWYTKGRDPAGSGTIIVQYSAPNNLTPAEVGTLLDEKVHRKDISAEIINLAVKGYLKITRLADKGLILKKADYLLEKLSEADERLSGHERMLLKYLFKKGKKIKNIGDFYNLLSDGKNKSFNEEKVWKKLSVFYKAGFGAMPDQNVASKKAIKLSDLNADFYDEFKRLSENIVSGLAQKGYFKSNPRKVIVKYIFVGVAFVILGFFAGPILGPFGFAGFLASGLLVMVFGKIMPAKTEKGVKAKEHILGLKIYLKVAEKDRIKFHNSPKKDPEVFEKLLPFAMVLGVEKEWAGQFEGIYEAKPSWYGDAQAGNFSALAFAGSLNAFRNTANTIYRPASHSSAASGGSGFSGGASGGGFGGGGGRSW